MIAQGGIRREAVLNLVALRALTGPDANASQKLQRYVLGLALVALLAGQKSSYVKVVCSCRVTGRPLMRRSWIVLAFGLRSLLPRNPHWYSLKQAAMDFGVGEAMDSHIRQRRGQKGVREEKGRKSKKAK